MKSLFGYSFVFLFFLASCGKKETTENKTAASDPTSDDTTSVMKPVKIDARKIGPEKSTEQEKIEQAIEQMEKNKSLPIVGYWVGAFGKNKINIALAGIANDQAIGYTVCAGNYRPIEGKVSVTGDSIYTFQMKEPGTDQYDGEFHFMVNTNKGVMEGSWAPFKKGAATSKKFTLTKKAFEYNTDAGIYPQASSELLGEADVENMLEEELEVMRNEIYARHGYSFKDKEMRARFDSTSWYIPMGVDIREQLTDIEVQNIDLIYRYEEYYEENYDSYGR
jgi:hypothetical protein